MTDEEAFTALGLKPGAFPDRIRSRYRDLAWEAHPDRGGTTEEFMMLGEAVRTALEASLSWPCERCRGTGKLALRASFGAAAAITCGSCGGTGKKW